MEGINRVGRPCELPCMAASLMPEHQAPDQDGSCHSLDTEPDGSPMDGGLKKGSHTVCEGSDDCPLPRAWDHGV